MSDSFEIALLIPHYNQLSKLNQSLETVDFAGKMIIVVVDDGSDEAQKPDEHWSTSIEQRTGYIVRLIRHDRNRGIEDALNSGLDFILSLPEIRYIARLDCGDFNVSGRFDMQYEFMEANKDVCLVGSWADIREGQRVLYTIRTPSNHEDIRKKMLLNNCFIHPTVMLRCDAVRKVGFYPTGYGAAEDYAYFFLYVERCRTANIPKVLVHLPRYSDGISRTRRRDQLVSRMKVIKRHFQFTPYGIWGVLRTLIFFVIPLPVIEFIKTANDRTAHH